MKFWILGLLGIGLGWVAACDVPTDHSQQANPVKDALTATTTETSFAAPLVPFSQPHQFKITSEAFDQNLKGTRVRGFFATPKDHSPVAAILLVHEWWGLDETVRQEAEGLAREGFKVLAIDLYEGQVASGRAEAARLMRELQPQAVATLLKAALGVLRLSEDKRPLKIGAIGWGLGAGHALELAMDDKRLAALVVHYGEVSTDRKRIKRINCPVLGIFASQDGWVTPQQVEAFDQALAKARVEREILSFDTSPGFMLHPQNNTEKTFAETAREQELEFLKAHLIAP
jgi:carboxymethylenebutenolidase